MKKTIIALGLAALIIGVMLIALPFVSIPVPFDFTTDLPKSQILLSEKFEVPPTTVTHWVYLTEGDNVSMIVSPTKAGSLNSSADDIIDFSVNAGSQTYLSYNRTSGLHGFVWTVPKTTNYSFVYDNSFSTASKQVIVQLTKYWTETEHHSVTLVRPLIPFMFAYVGAVVVLGGIASIVFGTRRRSNVSALKNMSFERINKRHYRL